MIADATIANRIADLTIFVVRAGKLDRRQLPDIEKLYQEKKLKNMALVLNGAIRNVMAMVIVTGMVTVMVIELRKRKRFLK